MIFSIASIFLLFSYSNNLCSAVTYPQFSEEYYTDSLQVEKIIDSNYCNQYIDNYSIIRYTIGISGSSKFIPTSAGTYSINHSIGQSSVIGTNKNNNYVLLQGYQQGILASQSRSKPAENVLIAKLYPNPFNQSVNILIQDYISNDIHVSVYDILGRQITATKYAGSNLIKLPLQHLSTGVYVLMVTTGKKKFVGKIIKQYP